MKRNRNYQGNQHQLSSSGPLLTNHLRDLDHELELLNRKRVILEQKQNILNRETYSAQRQYEHDTPNQYIQPFNNSQRYDGSSHFGHYRPQGVKRQAINPWQIGVPQLRQSQPIPLMGLQTHIGPRSQKPVQPFRKNFQPSKVTKPKPQPAPNKLASYPVEKTNKLVTQAMKAIDRKPDETQILRADRNPTLQVKGRLELALGMVMKQIKEDHCSEPDDLNYFMTNFAQRLLKHTIRTRIRSVMMDQNVGAARDIVDAYRIKYPKETDNELINVAKDAQCLNGPHVGSIQVIDADDPEEFFKNNMTKVLNTKLEAMFNKLEDIYVNAGANLEDIEKLPEPSKENDNEKKQEPKRVTVEEMCGDDGSLTKISENTAKVKYYTKFMEELIEDRLPKILLKFKNILLSIVFCEKEFLGIKTMITAQLKKKILKLIEKDETYLIHNKKVVSDKSKENADEKFTSNEKEEETTPEIDKPSIETIEGPSENSEIDNTHTNDMKEKNDITKEAKENDSEVNKTKLGTTEIDKPASVVTPGPEILKNSAPTPSSQTPQTTLAKDMFYVKLIGRPVLPARAVIYDFLKKFNPASIKKHKSISNLLVLGFSDRENFDKILRANESIVGESTIVIKASEQVSKNKQTLGPSKDLNATNTLNENKYLDNSDTLNETKLQDSSEINDLDSQITDLLLSIKKCEEDIGIVVPEAPKEDDEIKTSDGNMEVSAIKENSVDNKNEESSEKLKD